VDIQHRIENNILSWGRKGKKKREKKSKKGLSGHRKFNYS
jgi:hypothetical protein